MGMIKLHSISSGRDLYIRPDQIDLIAAIDVAGFFDSHGNWRPPAKASQIVLRSGEKGECRESPEQILHAMAEMAPRPFSAEA